MVYQDLPRWRSVMKMEMPVDTTPFGHSLSFIVKFRTFMWLAWPHYSAVFSAQGNKLPERCYELGQHFED